MAKRGLSEVLAFRFTRKDVRKLDNLARATFRGRADVMRCLIELADVAPARDLVVRLSVPAASERAPETADVAG